MRRQNGRRLGAWRGGRVSRTAWPARPCCGAAWVDLHRTRPGSDSGVAVELRPVVLVLVGL